MAKLSRAEVFLSITLGIVLGIYALLYNSQSTPHRHRSSVCTQISDAISSSSHVYYTGHANYSRGIEHWSSSSSQHSECVVEPGIPQDIGTILQILSNTSTPFAVKGGGHTSNPGFSSTTGVHISMVRFSEITYDAKLQSVQVGAGLVWDDVYAALEHYGVNVVGGRVSGVGVAGFTLGGGYSWKTNQHGLTIDTVTAYELVKPDGNVINVTRASDPELFFGLKGGGNNFGIVTKFTLKTFPQTQVWGGLTLITSPNIPALLSATAAFSSLNTDPRAGVIANFHIMLGRPLVTLIMFYDAPTPPPGVFEDFLAIPYLKKDVRTRSFLSLVKAAPLDMLKGTRGTFSTVPLLSFTPHILNVIFNETVYWGTQLSKKGGVLVSYSVEPFLPTLYTHIPVGERTAFPPIRSESLGHMPFNIYYSWKFPNPFRRLLLEPHDNDVHFYTAMRESTETIFRAAMSERAAEGLLMTETGAMPSNASLDRLPLYPNYAMAGTLLSDIYGDNLPELKRLKARVDPNNVMGLAGGFKL